MNYVLKYIVTKAVGCLEVTADRSFHTCEFTLENVLH